MAGRGTEQVKRMVTLPSSEEGRPYKGRNLDADGQVGTDGMVLRLVIAVVEPA